MPAMSVKVDTFAVVKAAEGKTEEVEVVNTLNSMVPLWKKNKKEVDEKALNDCKGYLRSELAKKLKARKMPELIFKYDEALAYGNHIENILAEIHKNEKK